MQRRPTGQPQLLTCHFSIDQRASEANRAVALPLQMQRRNKIFSDLYCRRNKMFSAEESKLSFMVDPSTEITGKASGKLRLIHQRILQASSITKNKNLKTRRQLSEAKKSAEMNSLQLEGTDTSRLPDKSSTESIGDRAPKTEVVLERHITGNLVEVSTATKKCVSPREPKAELSGKLVGKRSSQRKIELPDKYGSKRSMLQDSRTTESKVLEAVSQKQFTESILVKCGKKIQPSGEVSNKLDGRISLVEVDGSSTDPSKLINSEDDPALTPAPETLNNKNSLTSRKENSNVRRKYKKEKYNLPRRSSKRLAGQQPEPINNLLSTVRACSASATKYSKGALDAGLSSGDLENRATHCTSTEVNSTIQGVPLTKVKSPLEGHEQPIDLLGFNEQTHQVAIGESSGGDASQDAGTASEMFVNGPSFQVGASSQAEDFFDTLDDIKSTSHESLNDGILLLDDQVIRKEQHHKLESEEFPQKLSFLFQDDPCFDFAYQILARESPINYKPILERAADMVQKDKPVATGSCSRNLTAKSCSSKAIQAVELEHEASDQNVAIQEKKVANDPCNIITLGHEESLNKIEKSLENQTATEEKPQTLEAELAAVENPCIEFSFPFHDTCPDSDPFFHFAFQSFREDDLFQAYFQENLNTIYNEVNSPAPPSFFECDITPQFDTTGAYVPVFPENSYWPLAGSASQPLSVESSSQPAGNEGFSIGSGVGSDQLISTTSSSLPAGNMASSNLSGVATEKPCLVVKQEECSESVEDYPCVNLTLFVNFLLG